MKMQPRPIMQSGVMPLQGIGGLAGLPSCATIVMSIPVDMAPAGMAPAGMTCTIDALKNATASRMASQAPEGMARHGGQSYSLPDQRVQAHS